MSIQIKQLLVENGATNADENAETAVMEYNGKTSITHIIAKDTTFEGYDTALENRIAVVTVRIFDFTNILTKDIAC
jgi:hypothetical protein